MILCNTKILFRQEKLDQLWSVSELVLALFLYVYMRRTGSNPEKFHSPNIFELIHVLPYFLLQNWLKYLLFITAASCWKGGLKQKICFLLKNYALLQALFI